MSEEFVSKEVFEQTVKMLEAKCEAERLMYERHVDKLSSVYQSRNDKLKNDIEALHSEIAGINARIDDLKYYISWAFGILGFGITAVGVVIAVLQVFLN